MMLEQLAATGCAAPLFLVDEIDKPSGERYPIVSALLELLEPENAAGSIVAAQALPYLVALLPS